MNRTPCTHNVAAQPAGSACPECHHTGHAHLVDGACSGPCTVCVEEIVALERAQAAFDVTWQEIVAAFRELVEAFNPLVVAFAELLDAHPSTRRRLRRELRDAPARRRQRATWQHVDRRRRARRRR